MTTMEPGVSVLTADEVRAELRADIARLGISRQAWAERKGFSAQFISGVLQGVKEPSADLCAALGIVKASVVTYTRAPRRGAASA